MKKRLDYLDLMKGFGILLVVTSHIEDIPFAMRIWISAFTMPLFFVSGGILMAIKDEPSRDLKTSISKRFKGIIVPYLWFSLSYFVLDIGNLLLHKIDEDMFWENLITSATFYGKSVMWFMPAFFLANVIFLALKKRLGDVGNIISIVVLVILAVFAKDALEAAYDANADSLLIKSLINTARVPVRAVIATPFVEFGYYFHKLMMKRHPKIDDEPILPIRIVLIVVGVALLVGIYYIGLYNGIVDMHYLVTGNIFIYYLAGLIGSYAIMMISKGIPPFKLLVYYGKNSLIVMAVHLEYYILWAGWRIAKLVRPHVKVCATAVYIITCVVIVFALSTIMIEVINRFFPWVLGKPMKKKEA